MQHSNTLSKEFNNEGNNSILEKSSLSFVGISTKDNDHTFLQDNHDNIQEIKLDEDNLLSARLDQSYFETRLQNRTGIPTITAKGRNMMNTLNWENINISENEIKECNQLSNSRIDAPLMIEIQKIEKQAAIKMKMETFILYFNKDYHEGIKYISESSTLDEKPYKIAYLMLTTQGLSKEMIGKCLGSHEEKNIALLQAYCELLDFRELEFDKALRLFLSTFKLPGEAQQIERILKTFASVYYKDNPKEFDNADIPFILSYSLLMLNTDAHSEKIQPKDKMTKEQFINNNISVCSNISKDYLARMYDNIVKEKFETKTDYIESVYNRLYVGQFELQGLSLKNAVSLACHLSKGSIFIKYGRKGNPHPRFVWISEQDCCVFWRDPQKSKEKPRKIRFDDIRDIMIGCNTTQVLKKHKHTISDEHDPLFFSLITLKRTLDLKAFDVETRIKWEEYFRLLLVNKKKKISCMNNGSQNLKVKEKERLSEIWKIEILPNWEFHWDYKNCRPKGLKSSQKTRTFPTKKPNNKHLMNGLLNESPKFTKSKLNLDQSNNKIDQINTGDTNFYGILDDEYFKELLKNKTTLLVSLWKHGLPDWLKKTLWPLIIQNKLEVTQELYQILVDKANQTLDDNLKNSFSCIEKDIKCLIATTTTTTPHNEKILKDFSTKQSLINILKAFIIYRPDIGYVKSMCNIVNILLLYLNDYETFKCFINLIHSYHFLSFFKGDIHEIEWRIILFDQYFKQELPSLFNHFKGLDLSSDMYLLDWFLTLYSMNLSNINIISRIWDCFLIYGELYAIKVAITILKYFETELRMLSFDGAIKFLKKCPNCIDENEFFEMIDNINIPDIEYKKFLQMNKKNKVNSLIHQALKF